MSGSGKGERGTKFPPAGGASGAAPSQLDLSQLSEKFAALSQEMSSLTQMIARAGPKRHEIDAASAALKRMSEAYSSDPDAITAAQHDLTVRQMKALQEVSEKTFSAAPDPGDDPIRALIAANPSQAFAQAMFNAHVEWSESLAMNAPGLTDIERRRAAYMLRQANAAMAPANTLASNPRALKAMLDSGGASVQRGLAHLQADINADPERPNLLQTDPGAFRLGENIATTPGEVVFRNKLIELIRYFPSTEEVREVPLLIFPPWINKYYVLDLTPENSLVAWLRDQGVTVYMVSWRSADERISDFDWDDYLKFGGRAALDWVSDAHGGQVNTAGYCIGGALLSVLAARLAQDGDDRISSITLMAAQTDFSEPGDLGLFIDDETLPGVQSVIDEAGGVMPGEAMRDAFNLLRPQDLIWRFVEHRYLLGEDPKPFDLLHWNSDQTNLPGPLHMQTLKQFYVDNALARGQFEVGGRPVDLAAINCPVFIHAARKDHISPFPSVYKSVHLFGGEVTFLLADSGHIAGVVNPPDAHKYRYWTGPGTPPKGYLAWEADASEHPGSWWPVWGDWLSEWSGDEVPPPKPIEGATPAPGEYVRETLASIREKDGR